MIQYAQDGEKDRLPWLKENREISQVIKDINSKNSRDACMI
jgi:hypothetical protein